MNSRAKTYLLVFLAASTSGFAVLAWSLHRHLGTLQASVSQTASDDADLRRRLDAAEKRARDLENELAALKQSRRDQASSDLPPGDGPNADPDRGRRGRGRGPEALMALMGDPKFVKLMNSREKAAIDSRYAALFKTLAQDLKLAPQQIDAFKDLLVEKQNTLRDVVMTAHSEGVHDRAAIGELVRNAQSELDSQIQSSLGTEGYAQYQQYEKTQPQRTLVNQLAQSLSYTATPLSDNQQQQLLQILSVTSSSNSNGVQPEPRDGPPPGAGLFGGPLAGSQMQISDAAVDQAKTVLNPDQVSALKNLQDQQKAQAEFVQTMRSNRAGSPPTAPEQPGTNASVGK